MTNSTKAMKEDIVLTRLKLFHLVSIFPLKSLNSVRLNFPKSVLSNNSFSGIFPTIVTRKTPMQYKREESNNNTKTNNFGEPKFIYVEMEMLKTGKKNTK